MWQFGDDLMNSLFKDIRYGFRSLMKHLGFTTIAVITLALGIGASTAIISAVNPILFESLPYPHADRIVMIWEGTKDGGRNHGTFATYRAMVERTRSFESLAVMRPWQPTVTGPDQPERLDGQRVSASYFRVLGVAPGLGRDLLESEDQLNGPKVAIISDGLWKRRFGSDKAIVGRQVRLDDNSYTVVGVMPGAFENVLAPSAEIWSPLQYDQSLPLQGREWGHHLRTVGRLRSEASMDQATRELEQILRDLAPVLKDHGIPEKFIVNTLQDDVTGAVKPTLLAVLGAVLLLLAIACVNVTNLLLARGAQRRGEFAMRAALGAGRMRMIRQLLTESLLLAVFGGALGMVVAELGVNALVALSPAELPRVDVIRVDGAVLAFGIGITTLIGLVVGLVPAFHASRVDLHTGLQQSSQRAAGGHQLTRRALVVTEVALALVLLVGAGLLLRSLQRLFAISPGFDASQVVTMQVQTSGHRFDEESATHRFFAQALEAVQQVPGVTAAAFTSQLPLSGDLDEYGVQFEQGPSGKPEGGYGTFRYGVTPGYFEAMGIPLRRGRLLDAHDIAGAPVAVLISESLAKRKFPGQDPIGHRLHVGRQDLPWYTIVGVVGDVKQASLALTQSDAVYIPAAQWYAPDSAMSLVVRARGDAAALVPVIKQAIWSVDKDQPILRVATMDDLLAASAAERRFVLILFQAFALVALVLAATGIYGVLSGSVTERTREIGIRLALGASRRDILALVVRQGMTLTGLGVVIGLSAALAASQAIVTLLFGVSRLDPITYLGVIALLGGVSMIACWAPARRAIKVDPLVALRYE
jgi:putative ABC transport system permease protein